MFSASVQPSTVSLFSSTGSDPLGLFSTHADPSLPADSFICSLNDATSEPAPPPPRSIIPVQENSEGPDYALKQTVLHIQSPTVRTTFIRCPPGETRSPEGTVTCHDHLGLKHPWIHFQVRNLRREWAFEVGIVDQSGREGIVRCATFQKEPKLKLTSRPILLLPLSFPPSSSRPLTSWCIIAIRLPTLLPHFGSAALAREDEPASSSVQVPSGTYSHVSYVKVYATCRLRRIWFSEGGPQQQQPWEFQLYAADGM
ncbi:hypothetical protein C8Q78DRAFT_998348 [Trametes maxima]|nr:hypothetical protein C8Q78DRAFT_998348 [Trametes maxima]